VNPGYFISSSATISPAGNAIFANSEVDEKIT
jgi:hypothetical protein